MESEASQTMSLKVLVEKEKNRIVFVEANKDFVDVLFSFLTLPIGTIVRLTREHFLKEKIGCLNNLYESLEKFDEDFLSSEHKGILLRPRCATDVYCRDLKVNLVECNKSKYYACCKADCSFVSYYQNDSCPCGEAIYCEVNLLDPVPEGGSGFIKPTVRFMITDDFQVLPMSTMAGLSLLANFGALDGSKIEERLLNIGKDEEFPHLSFKGCLGNLYKSVHDFDVNKFYKSEEMKAILLDPKLAPGTSYNNKLIGIEEAANLSCSTLSSLFKTEYIDLSSESPLWEVKIGGGLVKGPSMFMVTDSLSIAPLSPISGISLINRLKVPLSDIQELETLRLLVASLVSRSALTDAFVLKETKQET
ncbi:hypothetical protein RHGRI_032165 [Rhododendron griersonianum]|uniref:DUF674 family protein n=1 Tax=Rhododendron griersonianum TaxID=479676 RepID=A0AAV6IGL5_9ERIC|nr:hypothetical protein RHGRI_032165 [Rhododendron griersonianum]